jgi:hypothetical protein
MNKTISNCRKVGGEYFRLIYLRKSNKKLSDFLTFNFDEYWCFKSTSNQRLITYEEFLEFKYSSYTFFRKDLYSLDRIIEWVDWCIIIGGIQFLIKPTPTFNPNKIIIRK